jgi:hypothetical protein
MVYKRLISIVSFSILMGVVLSPVLMTARNNPLLKERRGNTTVKLRFAENCNNAVAQIDKDVVRDLKSIVHRHLRSVSAGVEAARTTRDAADAA